MRAVDRFLTSMFESVPGIGDRYRIPVFNPGSNPDQVSQLSLVNPGDQSATIRIEGIDDDGVVSSVSVSVPPGLALTVTAQDLESGIPVNWPPGAGIDGALGNGKGNWQLILTASAASIVMSLLIHSTTLRPGPGRSAKRQVTKSVTAMDSGDHLRFNQ